MRDKQIESKSQKGHRCIPGGYLQEISLAVCLSPSGSRHAPDDYINVISGCDYCFNWA